MMIDNTAAVSVINNMGTCHCDPCNSVAGTIWSLCKKIGIWLTAAHIPGKENVMAVYESRYINFDTKWMLNSQYLSSALRVFTFTPVVDQLASCTNKQFDQHVSYRPDPLARYIDAFTIPWTNIKFYIHSVVYSGLYSKPRKVW